MKHVWIFVAAGILLGCSKDIMPQPATREALERPFSGSGTLVWREQRYEAALTRDGGKLEIVLHSDDLIEPVTFSSWDSVRELSQGTLSQTLSPSAELLAAGMPETLLQALERLGVCVPSQEQGTLRLCDGDCAATLDPQTLALKTLETGQGTMFFQRFAYTG